MTLEEIKESDWYQSRPEIIQQAIDFLPPSQLYKIKSTGHQCQLYSYEEPKSGKLEDVTVTVIKTGIGGALDSIGLGILHKNQGVFGLKLSDLEPWK